MHAKKKHEEARKSAKKCEEARKSDLADLPYQQDVQRLRTAWSVSRRSLSKRTLDTRPPPYGTCGTSTTNGARVRQVSLGARDPLLTYPEGEEFLVSRCAGSFGGQLPPCGSDATLTARQLSFYFIFVDIHQAPKTAWGGSFRSRVSLSIAPIMSHIPCLLSRLLMLAV